MADAREPDEGGSDLFDRWLSHRQESTGEAPRPRTYGVPRTGLAGEEPTDPRSSRAEDTTQHGAADGARQSATDAAADAAAVAATDAAAVQPPEDGATSGGATSDGATSRGDTSDGEVHPAHADPAPTGAAHPDPPTHREPVGLDEFEPVVIASVRRQAETPVEKRSRLARFRRAGLEPDPADDPGDEAADLATGETGNEPPATDSADAATDDSPVLDAATGTPPPALPPTVDVAHQPTPPSSSSDQLPADRTPPVDSQRLEPPSTDPQPDAPPRTPRGQEDAAAAVFAAFNPGTATAPAAPPQGRHRATPPPGPTPADAPASTPPPSPSPTADAPAATPRPSPTPTPTPTPTPAATPATPATPATTERPRRPRRARPSLTSYVEAARSTVDRAVRGTPEEREATSPPPASAATPVDGPPVGPDRSTAPGPAPANEPAPARSAYDELRAQREAAAPPQPDVLPPSIDFRPRTLARRVTSVLLLVGLVATGIAAWRAYDSRIETDIGLAAILALATGIVWAVRAGSVPTRVGLHGGVLEVRSQAGRFVFEVTGAHTRLEVIGTPGRRSSRLLVHRRGLAPFAITPAMVDLRSLVEALRYYRPDL